MQIQRENAKGKHVINSFEPGTVVINDTDYHRSLLVSETILDTDWSLENIDAITEAHCQRILTLKPQLVLLGTGVKQRFPAQALLAPLYQANIGVEIMDTHAACRTFNVLLAEDRRVVAALIV